MQPIMIQKVSEISRNPINLQIILGNCRLRAGLHNWTGSHELMETESLFSFLALLGSLFTKSLSVHTSLRTSLSQSHLILEICSWCCWCSTRRSPAFILSAWIMLLRASSVCFLAFFSSTISCRSFTLSWSKKRRASSLASRVSAVRTWTGTTRFIKKRIGFLFCYLRHFFFLSTTLHAI